MILKAAMPVVNPPANLPCLPTMWRNRCATGSSGPISAGTISASNIGVSSIGPVWITLNTALFIVGFGLVGAQLFKWPIEDYLPFFCAGQILFTFLSALINEGCQTYISADAFLKQSAYPKFAFVLRVVWRNLILLGHNLVVVVVVLLWFGGLGKVDWLAFLTLLVTTLAAGFVVAIAAAHFSHTSGTYR